MQLLFELISRRHEQKAPWSLPINPSPNGQKCSQCCLFVALIDRLYTMQKSFYQRVNLIVRKKLKNALNSAEKTKSHYFQEYSMKIIINPPD